MKLLIVGDSFASNWKLKYPTADGWPNKLAVEFDTVNLAQAGCSEYRILKQLESIDLSPFQKIIISHTNPYRIYTEYNPVRRQDPLHQHCDLLYNDVVCLASRHREYQSVVSYFEKFYSLEHADYVYRKIRQDIDQKVGDRALQITHTPSQGEFDLDFSRDFEKYPGVINHYNDLGNTKVFQEIMKKISI